MAAPVVATVGANNEVYSATITLAAPASIADGDLLEATIYTVYHDSSDPALTGWTLKSRQNDGGNFSVSKLWKRAASESGSYAFVATSAVYQTGFIRRITGAIASGDPYDVVGTIALGTSTTATATAVTTTVAETLLSWDCGTFLGGTTVSTPPSGMSGTQAIALYTGHKEQTASGSTGTQAGTLSGSDSWGVFLSAILPVAGGGGTVNSKTISDALTVSESNPKFAVRSPLVSHAVSVAESIVRSAIHNRLSSDSVTITEEGTYKELSYTLQDSIDVNQTLSQFALHNRAISDAIAIAETVSRVAYRNRLSSDALTITETLARWALHYRLSLDTLTVNEFITGTRIGIGATINTKTILDALTVIDYLTSSALHNRELTDVVNIAESVTRAAYHNRSIADQIDILDALVASYVQDPGAVVYNVRITLGIDRGIQPIVSADRNDASILGVY